VVSDAGAALQVAFLVATPFLHLALGDGALALVSRALRTPPVPRDTGAASQLACLWALGLLGQLALLFLLRLVGLPWWAAVPLSFAPALARLGSARQRLRAPGRIDWNLVCWMVVVVGLGASLFEVEPAVTTVWKNNWGDLAFHLGMIASFTLGGIFPPEYHVYAGEPLSYHFLVNLWSASLWWPDPSLPALRRVFVFQWVLLWAAIYLLLDGRRNPGLPWALLFGGGSLLHLGQNAGSLIAQGMPWTAFLPTIWVTQRAAVLGACAALAALRFFLAALDASGTDSRRRLGMAAAGLVLALSPLAHLHLCAVAGAWIGLVLVLRLPGGARDLATFAAFALPSLLWLPWLVAKAGSVTLAAGWATGDAAHLGGPSRLAASALMWLESAPLWLLLAAFLGWRTRRSGTGAFFAALLLLFVAGNLVQLGLWDWERIKIFLGLGIVFLALWSRLPGRAAKLAQAACLLLALPGIVELRHAFAGGPHTLYTARDVERAELLRERTPQRAVIASAPRHDTLATLSGRRLFAGYEGTLWSHGIDFAERARLLADLDALARCRLAVCPTHLLWTIDERRFWQRDLPGEPFQATELEFLYVVPPDR
jgi:hypothetical protein